MPRLPDVFRRALDSNGDASPGAKIYVYRAGTTTAVTTYSDAAMTTANASPIVADSSGSIPDVYMRGGFFKVKTTDADDVDLPGSPADDVEVADEMISVGTLAVAALTAIYPTRSVAVRGGTTEGDEAGGTYVYRDAEPTRTAKFQDANGYWFEKVVAARPVPQDFGAIGDGVTDDGAAINAWATHLVANNLRGYWPAGEYFTGTTTLYLGGVQADCGGSKTNERWTGIGTVVKSNANPVATNTQPGSAGLYTNTVIHGLSLAGAGGAVGAITLWDDVDYLYQVGWMLGRGPGYVDGGAAVDGYGVFHIVGGTIQDMSGWGSYQYEGTGDSTVERIQYRCCGGKAAYELGVALGDAAAGDRLGGAILVQANSVDTMYIGCHAINSNNADGALGNALYDDRATCLRLGATKTVTDALSRDYGHAINNVHFQNLHSEGYAVGLDLRGTKWSVFSECNINGSGGTVGTIDIGIASNPGSSDLRVQFDNCRVASAESINVIHGANVSLGELVNGTPSTATTINYYRDCKAEFLGAGHTQAALLAKGWVLNPKADPATDFSISDDTTWVPNMRTGALPTSVMSNLLPSFNGGSGTTLTGWTAEGAGTMVVNANGATVSVMNEKTALYALTGQTPGDLYTYQFWTDWTGEVSLGDLLWKIQDGSDADVHVRAVGSGAETDGSYYYCVQFRAPADGEIRLRFRLGPGAVAANFRAPILQLGAAASIGSKLPTQWVASDGIYSTS